jgi:hypothetical protein
MENRSCRKVQGSCAVTAPAGVTATPAETAFVLEPKAASAISIRLANLAAVQTREHIKAVLRYGESETVACELVQPPVLNGGFERCTAGDGWPDEWNYRSPESLYLKGAVLDTRDFVEGKQSLRLDPNPAEYPNAVSSTLLRLVPDTEYRVRCQIRRSAHGNIGVRLFSMGAGDKKRAVDVYLGYKKDGPVGVWEKFAATFKSADIEVPYQVIASNWTKGAATVWFDDIAVEPVK